jgi:N6-L-threonylcarbamoyladenine synthase
MIDSGVKPEDVALFTITYLCNTLDKMTEAIKQEYGKLPFVFAGGVMSNTIIRKALTEKHGACFASTELSSDNAVGTAVMTYLTLNK